MRIRLAVDCMGGDEGLPVTIPAVLQYRKTSSDVDFILVGRESDIRGQLRRFDVEEQPGLSIVHAPEIIGMDESPLIGLKGKKQSSMRVAIEQVRDRKADACLSAGNTGALMATAHFVLKMMSGISRPAIAGLIPSHRGGTLMLDMGANVESTPEHLRQFALMGFCLGQLIFEKSNPSVGLLNVGVEEFKGSEKIKLTLDLLRQSSINFLGSVEGYDIFMGDVDIVICDGFVGNVVIKSMEGLSRFIRWSLEKEWSDASLLKRLSGVAAAPFVYSFKNRIDHRGYNGGYLLGLRGLVLKSHGNADQRAFSVAIHRSVEAARCGLLRKIQEIIEREQVGQ